MDHNWYVAHMDDGIVAVVHSKQEALEQCKQLAGDARKTARLRPYGKSKGFYEYSGPRAGRDHLVTYDVGTRTEMLRHAYNEAMEAYEAGRPYNTRSDDWNVLAAPKRM